MKDIVALLIKARRDARAEIVHIQEQITRISQALDIIDPPPEIRVRTSAEQYRTAILEALGRGEKLTTMEIGRKIGRSSTHIYRILDQMQADGTLDTTRIGGVRHYQKPREELRLVAGHGVTSHKRVARSA
jgi:hypothetical protein